MNTNSDLTLDLDTLPKQQPQAYTGSVVVPVSPEAEETKDAISPSPGAPAAGSKQLDAGCRDTMSNAAGGRLTDPRAGEHRYLRWNLLWTLIFIVLLVPLPLWIAEVAGCSVFFWMSNIVGIWDVAVLLFILFHAVRTTRLLAKNVRDDVSWMGRYPDTEAARKLKHVVVMSGYKEPLELMCLTIDSLKAQTSAKRLIVVVGLEAATPDLAKKIDALNEMYGEQKDIFAEFMVTVHPKSFFDGEVAGKCSNSNYALRYVVSQLEKRGELDLDSLTGTTCDTDSLFHPKYFEFVGYEFLTRSDAREVCWQAPLFYHYNLDRRPFFVRVTGVLRQMFMMGLLIPLDINPMSIYTFSMEMGVKMNFFHYRYQMEDIIATLRMMIATRKRVPVRLVPLPMISGPTSGESWREELYEWARQARRWTLGAGEVFHYFFNKLVFTRAFDLWSGLRYGVVFSHYYGFILCSMTLFSVSMLVAPHYNECTVHDAPNDMLRFNREVWDNGGCVYLGACIAILMLFQVVDRWAVARVLSPAMGVKERRNWVWINFVVDCILSWPALMMYNAVEFCALIELSIRGKEVCGHVPARKQSLAPCRPSSSKKGAKKMVPGGGGGASLPPPADGDRELASI